jgi:hypothetical protein
MSRRLRVLGCVLVVGFLAGCLSPTFTASKGEGAAVTRMCAQVAAIPGVQKVTSCYVSRSEAGLTLVAELVVSQDLTVDPMVVLRETARIMWGFEAWQPPGLDIEVHQGAKWLVASELIGHPGGVLNHYDLTEMFGPWTGQLPTPTIPPPPAVAPASAIPPTPTGSAPTSSCRSRAGRRTGRRG